MEEKDLALLHTYSTLSEFHAIKQMLEEEEIGYFLRSFTDTAYDDIYKPQYGMGRIYVKKDDLQRAKELLKELLEGE